MRQPQRYRQTRSQQIQNEFELHEQASSDLFKILEGFPREIFGSFKTAFFQGALLTFISHLTEGSLRKAGCTEKQIQMAKIITECIVVYYTGSFLASTASILSQLTLKYLTSFTAQNCSLTMSVMRAGIQAANGLSLKEITQSAAAMVGSVTGSYFTNRFCLWAQGQKHSKTTFKGVECGFNRP